MDLNQKQFNTLFSKVDKTPTGCWIWKGGLTPKNYGRLRFANKNYFAHRFIYSLLKGEIPTGLVLDHLCRNTMCVNPDHLEPVSQQENVLRGNGIAAIHFKKTHCKNGHPYSPENTRLKSYKPGHQTKLCLICKRQRDRKTI